MKNTAKIPRVPALVQTEPRSDGCASFSILVYYLCLSTMYKVLLPPQPKKSSSKKYGYLPRWTRLHLYFSEWVGIVICLKYSLLE